MKTVDVVHVEIDWLPGTDYVRFSCGHAETLESDESNASLVGAEYGCSRCGAPPVQAVRFIVTEVSPGVLRLDGIVGSDGVARALPPPRERLTEVPHPAELPDGSRRFSIGDRVRYAGEESAMRSEGVVFGFDEQYVWIRTDDGRERGFRPEHGMRVRGTGGRP